MGKISNEPKRKRKHPERFGEKAILGEDYSNDELDSEIDSVSNDGDFTPTKRRKYGQDVILSDDDDISESTGRPENFERRNFDTDFDLIDMAESSNHSSSNSVTIIGEKNRHESSQITNILQNMQQSLTTIMSSICDLREKNDEIFARLSVMESKLIVSHAKSSGASALVKDNDEQRKLKLFLKTNCLPLTNIDDMNRFERNLVDSDFKSQTVSINGNLMPHVKMMCKI